MKQVKKFTIPRKKWLRGEGGDNSRLLRPFDGKMCCLGIYLSKVGFGVGSLSDESSPHHVGGIVGVEACDWLLSGSKDDSKLADSLMVANDNKLMSEEDREADVAEYFKQAGITVKFA